LGCARDHPRASTHDTTARFRLRRPDGQTAQNMSNNVGIAGN
jgi:hypothetical protein